MLTDIKSHANHAWSEYTASDLQILAAVARETAEACAEIARKNGDMRTANEILEALHNGN